MYLIDRTNGLDMARWASEPPPIGPSFSDAQISSADTLEVWGTSCSDPGPDFSIFLLKDTFERVIASRYVEGY